MFWKDYDSRVAKSQGRVRLVGGGPVWGLDGNSGKRAYRPGTGQIGMERSGWIRALLWKINGQDVTMNWGW